MSSHTLHTIAPTLDRRSKCQGAQHLDAQADVSLGAIVVAHEVVGDGA